MFIIHGIENGHYIPLAFCLLRVKQHEIYNQCFKALVNVQNLIKVIFYRKFN